MSFKRYMHIERFGNDEVHGIELGNCYIFPKIDGTNASIWYNNGLQAGSRKRQLSLDEDNAGFYQWVLNGKHRLPEFFDAYGLRLFGEWLCLSGDTTIRLVSGGKNGHVRTLREMYSYYNNDVTERSSYIKKDGTRSVSKRTSWWKRYGLPQCFSLFQNEDIVKPQKIANIIATGDKRVFRVTTRNGYSIESTKDHMFFTNHGWIQLKDLLINNVVGVTELFNHRKKRQYGKGSRKIINKFKAIRDVGFCYICNSRKSLEIHHIDEDWSNNDDSNLRTICAGCHKKIHKNITSVNKSFSYVFDKIIKIEYIGIKDCYDISMECNENSASFVANGFIVHNCPHTLRNYREDAWRKFYVFDVFDDETEKYLTYEEYQPLLKQHGFDYIPPISIIKNASYENLLIELGNNKFLIRDGEGNGEGIVIKNYNYQNRFGQTVWAKIITNVFKEKHIKEMGAQVKSFRKRTEQTICDKYVSNHLVNKIYSKIVNEMEGWNSRYIPRLLQTVYYDLVNEEVWNIVKKMKNPTINFRTLNSLVIVKIKEIKPELF